MLCKMSKEVVMMPLQVDNEIYLTVKESVEYLGISKPTFYENVKPEINEYRLGAWRRIYYRQSELDRFRGASPVRRPK